MTTDFEAADKQPNHIEQQDNSWEDTKKAPINSRQHWGRVDIDFKEEG